MWHSSDLISIRFPRPQINPFTSLHPPLVSACRNSPPRRKRNTFWITALWILAQFFLFKKEEMGSFCPKSPPPWLSLFLPLTVDSPVTFTGHPKMQKKKKSGSVETAAGSWPTVLQVILAMSTPSALLLYRRRQQRSEFLWRGPLAGVRNVEPTAGFWTRSQYTHFLSVSAQTRVRSGGYLRLTFVVWQVLMSFFCLITSRSGRYGGWMLPWREREIRHYDNNHDNNNI